MRPLVLTLAGTALGVAAVLPLARPQQAPAPPSVQVVLDDRSVTADGPAVATRYGPVQVRVVVQAGRLLSATSLRLPDADDDSREINRAAGPRLDRQAVATQGQVDTVSGATWTSNGYRTSLQAALDTARAAGSPA